MSEKHLESPSAPGDGGAGDETRVLNVEHLHLHANEIDSLRRLADVDPELARIVVEQKDKLDAREHGSYRFGMGVTVFLVLSVLICLTYALVTLGLALSLLLLAAVLSVAVLIRVILTGQWSETSWIGSIINGIVRVLGGQPRD